MPLADPWLSARMAEYTVIRRAEAQLYPAIRDAVKAFLAEASAGPLGNLTAAADPNPAGIPSEAAWRRILGRYVLGPTRALWRGSFGRITGRPDDTPANDAGHGAGLADRLAGFRRAFADRLLRVLLAGRERGETGAQLTARVAALMTLEQWDGHVMTMTRTETMTALNSGALHGALAEQQRTGEAWEKRWQATHDQRVRHTHAEADGQIRPLHTPFEINGHKLQFPGDPKGPAGEVINCRCAARYAPAGDVSLTASAPQEGHPMTTATAPAPAPGRPITVSPSGRWLGTLGFMDEWSADLRMLAAPEDGVRARPLPLPLLVQEVLADGHEGSKLGIGTIDRIWTEGNAVLGEGRFDMEDPLGAKLARKVGLQFIRFVSLDVDDATSRQVVVDPDGNIVPDEQLAQMKGVSVGDVYSGWRIMGATLLAHPAFPNAAIALADENGHALTASAFADFVGYNADWGCVKPNGDAFEPCDCEDPDALPANPTGDGPFQPEPDPTGTGAEAAVKDPAAPDGPPAPEEDPALPDDPTQDVPQDILADEEQTAEVGDPAAADVIDAPCVVQNEDGTWSPADCQAPGAVPSNLAGDGPAEQGQDQQMAVGDSASDPVGDPASASPDPVSAPTHAGLALVAQDTGRVLLLQRAIDPEDPASGTWEFPGGSIDPGEDPQDAALREFAEETGITLPDTVTIQDGWTSPNGVYQAYIGVLAVERDLDLNPAHATRETVNPDDPQGEEIEVAAWWDPAHLPELAALREEVRDTPWDVLQEAIGSGAQPPADDAPQMSTVPEGCTPCQAVSITAAASGTFAAGWQPPSDWFQPPTGHSGAYGIRVDEDGRVGGYLAEWGSCHVGFKGRCVPPPHSVTDYSYFNVRPVRTNDSTVYCGLLTMDTGHASLSASATSALAHYDNTGTQAAVVRVGEDNHGIYAVGAVLPFLTPEQRLKLSLASFSGDWREIRGGVELIAALAVNSPGFPLAARKTGADNRPYALVAAGALPPAASLTIPAGQAREITLGAQQLAPLTVNLDTANIDAEALAAAVIRQLDARADRQARATAATGSLAALRTTTQAQRMKEAARRVALARNRITPQPQRKTETPVELVGTGALPTPSNRDIALAKNWVDQQGGLPPYIKRITKHLTDKGMDQSRAIATAVNAAKKMCASGDLNWPGIQKVNPGSKAEACAAVARWDEMKAAAHADN